MRYFFEAINQLGAVTIGEHEAESEAAVIEYLQKRQLIPISIKPATAIISRGRSLMMFDRINALDRISLVRNLAVTTKAGLSIMESLAILAQDTTKPLLKNILLQIANNMQNGQPLWQSFQYYKKHFPPFFVGMIRAAETSGKLDATLEELTQYLTGEYNLVRKIKSAMAYPLILLVASCGVIVILIGFVLPRIEETFKRSQVALPIFTKIMLAISHAMRYSILLDSLVIIAIVVAIFLIRRNDAIKEVIAKLLFKLPVVNDLLKKIVLVRFARTLGSLLSSGLLITEALKLAADSVGNIYYRNAILKVNDDIMRGLPLSKALASSGKLFPHFFVSLVTVGEKTGTLENILKTFADFYDEEVDYTLKSLTTFLEPILLLVMGLIIGFIVLSILLPIYQFVGKFI